MGTRARARSRAAAPRRQSAGNAPASRDSRASVRDTQNADGRNALPDETTAQGRHRDGVARARLQSHASDEYHRCPTAPGGDEGIVALVCCLRTKRTGKDGLAHPGGALPRAEKPRCPKRQEEAKLTEIAMHHASSRRFRTTKTHCGSRVAKIAVVHNTTFSAMW